MNIHATTTRIFIEAPPKEADQKTKSGIVLPDGAKEKKTCIIGKAFKIGPNVQLVEEGDTIVVTDYGFDEIEIEGAKYLVGLEENVLAILTNE